jgi:hypothetical protein
MRFWLVLVCGLLSARAWAQTAGMMSFQAVLKDGGGTPVVGAVTLELQIVDAGNVVLDATGDGVVNAADTFVVNTTALDGVISVKYGPVAPAVFNGSPRFLKPTVTNPPLPALTNVEIVTPPAVAEQLNARGSGAAVVVVQPDGKVGIGNASPQTSVDVRTTGFPSGEFRITKSGGDQILRLGYEGGGANQNLFLDRSPGDLLGLSSYFTYYSLVGTANKSLLLGTANRTDDIVIGSGGSIALGLHGSVGIGTTAPGARLHVENRSDALTRQLFNVADLNAAGSGGTNLYVIGQNDGITIGNTWRNLYLGASGSGGNPVKTITVHTSGNVGIGTSVPAAPLEVAGNHDFNGVSGTLRVSRASEPNKFVYFGYDSGDYGYIQSVHAGTAFKPLVLNPAGPSIVGIGRIPTANKLEVEGTASKSVAGSWLANSDRRIKTELGTVKDALAVLAQIAVRTFRYSEAYRGAHPCIEDRTYLGVVAQEFAEVFPDYVRGSGETLPEGGDEILQVDAWPLTVYSVAAIQELHARHNAEVAGLKAQNDALTARVERLERLLNEKFENGGN